MAIMGAGMTRRVSIADARNGLTKLLREVERGEILEVTRHGEPVAALIPMEEYMRFKQGRLPLAEAAAAFRNRIGEEALSLLDGALDDLRDRSSGREVEL